MIELQSSKQLTKTDRWFDWKKMCFSELKKDPISFLFHNLVLKLYVCKLWLYYSRRSVICFYYCFCCVVHVRLKIISSYSQLMVHYFYLSTWSVSYLTLNLFIYIYAYRHYIENFFELKYFFVYHVYHMVYSIRATQLLAILSSLLLIDKYQY